MEKVKKIFWVSLGMMFLGVAYIGVITPGIPWSTPTVAAAFCFAKGSKRWHDWIMNHRVFGPFLRNWSEKRVFPTKGKWAMIITMDVSLIIMYLTTGNIWLVIGMGAMMLAVSVWAWRYPGSVEEWQARVEKGLPVGWFR
jgi:uncharacterized membrane protein YbaN (DUF454 family)